MSNKDVYLILATVDRDEEPCGVPINYIVKDYDTVIDNNKLSFNVVANTKVEPNKFGTLWESILFAGEAGVVVDEKEKQNAFLDLFRRCSSGFTAEFAEYVKSFGTKAMVVNVSINNLSGDR
jgi:nitroimidazol reductase NimA-like FMN-containing flavoprotein (pyridoxamine 5'-phosphate oxidase superfamily)